MYRLATSDPDGPVIRIADGAFIPVDPANRDWQEFLEWKAQGNEVEPFPVPRMVPVVELPQPTTLEADPVNDMDAVTKRYVDEQIAEQVASALAQSRHRRG